MSHRARKRSTADQPWIFPVLSSIAFSGCGNPEPAESSNGDLSTPMPPSTPSGAAGANGGGGAEGAVPGANGGVESASTTAQTAAAGAPVAVSPDVEQSPGPGGNGPLLPPGEAGSSNAGSGVAGAPVGTGGQPSPAGASGGSSSGGSSSGGGVASTGDACSGREWPEADPAMPGPFEVVMEEEVGPEAGEPAEDGTVPRFTLFRPEGIEDSGLCHPVITWGNGTGSTPELYGGLLRHLTSHGFVVIGSNNTNVSRGDPKPMNVGIDWVLEQNEEPSSALYLRLDTLHIGATGHSQGAMATSQASSDERIVTSLPIEGANVQRDLHGPAMFFCGGLDDIVGCDGAMRALEAVTTLPAMYANFLSVDHGSWLSFGGNNRTDVEIAITAWMRVHLMNDQALRPWFYGASCELCTNADWEIERKNMDE